MKILRKEVAGIGLIGLLIGLSACSEGVQLNARDAINGAGTGGSSGTGAMPALSAHADGFVGRYYSGSGQCATCHDGLVDESGGNVSIAEDWSSSMMANSARDPYWIAKVAAETDRHPEQKDNCSRCHAPMANDVARKQGTEEGLLSAALLVPDNPLFDHAMDGVSCTLCHQIEDNGLLGSLEGVSGNFSVRSYSTASERPAYGPYTDPSGVYMQTQTQFNPQYGEHISRSEVCAACHDLRTPLLGNTNTDLSYFPEQMVFSEWRNSQFAREGDNNKTCQSCHMPEVKGRVMLASDGGGIPREGFSQHTFLGANTVMQAMLMNHREALGVSVEPELFEQSITRNREFLKTAASLEFVSNEWQGAQLTSRIRIRNLSGHKLPSGYPSRRVHIHFVVKNENNVVLFESGAVRPDGSIVGALTDADHRQLETHYEFINSANQVQIYESVMADADSSVTHSLMQADHYLKDNRLLPLGFDKTSASDDIKVVGQATLDSDFDAGGDEIVYRVDLSEQGIFTVEVELLYQPLAFGHIQELFDSVHLPAVDQFKTLFEEAALKSEVIATIEAVMSR